MPTNTQLKTQIDLALNNNVADLAITPAIEATQIKSVVDYVDQEIDLIQLIPGPQGVVGPTGPAGSTSLLTNATISGGAQNAAVPITVDVLTSSNADHLYYSVPNFTNDQTKIGKRIYVRNPTDFEVYIKGAPGVNITFYIHTTALVNGHESFQNPLLLEKKRSTELIYLGNIEGFERWASHLVFMPRKLTQGNRSTVPLDSINSSNINDDITVVTPNNANDNYIRLNPYLIGVGESMIVINASLTIDIRLLETPLHHHYLLNINSNTVPYVIPMGKSVRFTKGPSAFYFLAEIINY